MMEFLGEIKTNAQEDLTSAASTPTAISIGTNRTEIEFSHMINILIMHAQSCHVTLQVEKSLIYFYLCYITFLSLT